MNEKKKEEMPNYEGKKNPKDARKNADEVDTNVDHPTSTNSDIDSIASTSDTVSRGEGDIDDVSFF